MVEAQSLRLKKMMVKIENTNRAMPQLIRTMLPILILEAFHFTELQMTIPGKIHKRVGPDQK